VYIENNIHYTQYLGLISESGEYMELDSMKLTGLINWFARFADLICMSQYN
jgi:hypothetical protein